MRGLPRAYEIRYLRLDWELHCPVEGRVHAENPTHRKP